MTAALLLQTITRSAATHRKFNPWPEQTTTEPDSIFPPECSRCVVTDRLRLNLKPDPLVTSRCLVMRTESPISWDAEDVPLALLKGNKGWATPNEHPRLKAKADSGLRHRYVLATKYNEHTSTPQ
ncbi:hypothetical protein CDAR_513021 [Caerostris darwini]|uniref:Uncharacterized protein n=1 Tax=Caerostris darwini TaxID=1538125 RepID=A0AAV4S171_9ARAC|nr:hypothetical protein CDAR_513021 [Caerostris darwini]